MSHKSFGTLLYELSTAAEQVGIGAQYNHYKNPEILYCVVSLVILEATDEVAVTYSPITEPGISFVRPLTSWLEEVEGIGGKQQRFCRVN